MTKGFSVNKADVIATFEDYVKSGAYAEKSVTEKNLTNSKEELKRRLYNEDGLRHVFEKHGLVAKFVRKSVKKTNQPALISDILDYVRSSALNDLISLNTKQMEEDGVSSIVEEYQLKPTFYVKPTLNKEGKFYVKTIEEQYCEESTEQLIRHIRYLMEKNQRLQADYKSLMQSFNVVTEMKIQTAVGSISKVANKPSWNIAKIVHDVGEDFLVKYGDVKLSKIDEWIGIGALPKDILVTNQVVIDTRVDFMVMTLEAEERAFRGMNYHSMQRSIG